MKNQKGKDVEFLNIIIENKIYTKEPDRQTDKYYNHFNAFLKNNASDKVDVSTRKAGPCALYNLYVYLTPASPAEIDQLKQPESNCKECVQICYQELIHTITNRQKFMYPSGVWMEPCSLIAHICAEFSGAYSGDSRSPIPMISVHSVGYLLYRRQS